jgi:tetratricopeptide (TPR) repeat protein
LGDEEVMGNVLTALSSLYMDLNRYEDAEKCLFDALRIEHGKSKTDKSRLLNVAGLINNLGYVYSKSGDLEKAERFYSEALKIYRSLKDVQNFTSVLNNLCSIYLNMENVEKALELLDMMKEHIKEISPDMKARFYFLSAKAFEKKGDLTSALEFYLKAGALGFLVFRNFGVNTINFMHSFDKAEEVCKTLGLKDLEGDVKIIKFCIMRKYYGVKANIKVDEYGERGRVLLKAMNGERENFEVRDEIDSVVFVLTNDFVG